MFCFLSPASSWASWKKPWGKLVKIGVQIKFCFVKVLAWWPWCWGGSEQASLDLHQSHKSFVLSAGMDWLWLYKNIDYDHKQCFFFHRRHGQTSAGMVNKKNNHQQSIPPHNDHVMNIWFWCQRRKISDHVLGRRPFRNTYSWIEYLIILADDW